MPVGHKIFGWNQKWHLLFEAFFITFALRVSFSVPISPDEYQDKIDYYLAQAAELLGVYDLGAIFVFLMCIGFLLYIKTKDWEKKFQGYLFPFFFSVCLLLGNSYAQINSWDYCFGSIVNGIKSLGALIGLTLLLCRLFTLLLTLYERISKSDWNHKITNILFGAHCFRNVFILLILVWTPIILISYPGNVCYDVIGQIEQGIGFQPFSAHHPLAHTLIVGGMVKLFYDLTGSYDPGLFLYIIVQAILLASALAGTLQWLSKEKRAHGILSVILGIYLLAPMYSNMVSTALKDIPFMAMVIWYIIVLAELLTNRKRIKEPVFMMVFVVLQVLVMVLRNNGFYMVAISSVFYCIFWWKESEKEQKMKILLYFLILPVILSKLLNGLLISTLDAQTGSEREMLSLPFQQTARYLQLYREELPTDEKQWIEAVLGDVDQVAARYNPDIADPVKALYKDNAAGSDVMNYIKAWTKGFFRHPGVYFEAFFAHIYGWFYPGVSNAIRYEAEYSLFDKRGLFDGADKVLIFFYRLTDRVTILSLLQNVGAYTWALFLLGYYQWKQKKKKGLLLVPLFAALLICMASPCFYLHPRYAYPIMFTIPFLYGVMAERRQVWNQDLPKTIP